jgi:hypothetical protein
MSVGNRVFVIAKVRAAIRGLAPRTTTTTRIMTKHSKNNTASSIFSYAERKKLDYGTKGVRLFHSRSTASNGHRFGSNVSVMSLCEDSMRAPYVCSEQETQ